MTDTLKRLARLKQLDESSARRRLTEAQQAEEANRAEAEALARQVDELRLEGDCDADELQRRHQMQLRLELARRRAVRHSQTLAERTVRQQVSYREARMERRKAERVVEVVEERLADEEAKRLQAQLDAVGTATWFRRRAA